jgi:hypothetical protein
MTQPKNTNIDHLREKMATMTPEEISFLNERALVTLLFIYADGGLEFSKKVIEQHPSLAQQNRVVHYTVGDYSVLDLLRFHGYIDGESNRKSRWHKIFLTEKGLNKAKHLHGNFIKSSYENLF